MTTIVIDNDSWVANNGVFNANSGDVFIIDPGLLYSPTINGASDFDINFNESNSNAVTITTGANTIPTFNWAEGVATSLTTVNADASTSADFNVGDNATTYNLQGSLLGSNNFTFGNDATVVANIYGGNESDTLTTGTGFGVTNGSVIFGRETDTDGKGDTIDIGANSSVYLHVQTGFGSDNITIGDGFSSNGSLISYGSNVGESNGGDNIVIGNDVSIAGNIWMLGQSAGSDLDTTSGDDDGTTNSLTIGDNYTSSGGGIVGPFGKLDLTVGDNWSLAGVIYTFYGDDNVVMGASADAPAIFLGQLGNDTLTLTGFDETNVVQYNGGSQDGDDVNDQLSLRLTHAQKQGLEQTLTSAGYQQEADGSWTSSNPAAVEFFYIGNTLFSEWENIKIVCFASGTKIATQKGEVSVEDLKEGDHVITLDHGYQPIRWIGKNTLSAEQLVKRPELRPIRISAGALGNGMPQIDLVVSPQHRVLVYSEIANRMFNDNEVLVAAKHLVGVNGIEVVEDAEQVEYWHFIFDRHEIVYSNGARTESLYNGPEALKSIPKEGRAELLNIFPELGNVDKLHIPKSARQLVSGRRGRQMATRHAKNGRLLNQQRMRASA